MRRQARVDANQKDIVNVFRKMGAYIVHTHTLKNAFDVLVFHRGKIYPVEIKDGKQVPSKRKLTPGELICKEEIESHGCSYYVVESIQEAIDLLS